MYIVFGRYMENNYSTRLQVSAGGKEDCGQNAWLSNK